MPSFVKKLASRAAKKAVNKIVDGIFGSRNSGPGRVFTFGGMEKDMRFAANPDLLQYRSFFHDQLAREWSFGTPNRSLWYLEIDKFPIDVITNMKDFENITVNGRTPDGTTYPTNQNAYEKIVNPNPTTGSPRSILQNNPKNTQNTGCLFAQGVNLPQEQMAIDRAGFDNSAGFVPGLIARPRQPFQQLNIEFRETNTSFIDTVLRPWVVAASHVGLVTRSPSDTSPLNINVKADITVTQLGLFKRDKWPVIRKQFRFYNCVPVTINRQQMTYDTDAGSMNPIDTQWYYTHYGMKVDPGSQSYIGRDAEDGSDMDGFGIPVNDRDPYGLASGVARSIIS